MKNRKLQQAVPLILRALALNPDYLDARLNLAITFYDLKMKSEAAREFSQIAERYPRSREAKFARGMLRIIQSELR